MTTSFVRSTSAAENNFTTEPEINASSDTRRTDPPPTSTSSHVVEPDVTSSAARDLNWMMSRETDDEVVVIAIVAGVSGACLLVFLLLILVAFVVRRHRRSGKYDPSRPHLPDDGCRLRHVLCCPAGKRPAADPQLDASTARLKLNTSAAVSETSTGDRSYVSSRPLTGVVSSRTDPVQQTLIDPPSTNDAHSR